MSQFLQLMKLFKLRQTVQFDSGEASAAPNGQLMPPNILNNLLRPQSKTKKLVESLVGQIPLNIYCVTWNEDRSAQTLRCEELFPDKD